MKKPEDKIKIFLEAIPWIKKFKKKVFVLKYGGEILIDNENVGNITEDVELLRALGVYPVIVHGGGPQLDAKLKEKGITFEKKQGMRVYSKEILDIAQDVFGSMAKNLKGALEERGLKAKIISSDEVRLERNSEDLGYVGRYPSVGPLFSKIAVDGTVPIMTLFGWDESGELCNVNADDMAVSVAEALNAEKLIIHTSVDGVLDKKGKRITHLDINTAEKMIKERHIRGGMIPKVFQCIQSEKVGKIHIINGNIPHAMLYEVFTKSGVGTEIVRE